MKWLLCVVSSILLVQPAAAEQSKAPALDSGITEVEEGDFEAAIKTLERVIQSLPDDAVNARDRARAYLYMAIAYLGLSEEANARTRFLDALKQDRDLNLNPRQFSPRVLALFEQAKRQISGAAPVSAKEASPRDAVFFLAIRNGDFAAASQMLKEQPALVAARDAQFGATPLHWAALKGNEVMTGLLLAAGADPTATNNAGETPIKVASRAGKTGVVKLLRQQENRIFTAIKTGDVQTVRELLDEKPELLNWRDTEFGATPLHWAALKGQAAVVGLLLARGADATLKNSAGEAPLDVAVRAKKDNVILLLRPIEANLFAFVKANDVPNVQLILERDPSLVNRPDAAFGATPLHWAALKGHVEMVDYLLSVGADPNATNSAGETPIEVARRANRAAVVARLPVGAARVVPERPTAAPALSAGTTRGGDTEDEFFSVVKAGDVDGTRAILERNPSWINLPDPDYGATALHWAAAKGNVDLVSFLVSAGADLNAKNKAGETPLGVAERARRQPVIDALSSR
jgi:ankyrin repeat protein